MTISKRIRAERVALGLSQAELAERAGLTQGAISQMENNPRQGTRYLVPIAKALNVSAEWLESGRGEKRAVKSSRVAEAVSLLGELDDSQLDHILGLLRMLSIRKPAPMGEPALETRVNPAGERRVDADKLFGAQDSADEGSHHEQELGSSSDPGERRSRNARGA